MTLDDAVRQLELADEALKSSEVDAAAMHLSGAIRGFTTAGDPRRAALACVQLGNLFALVMGNQTAARAWFVRAARLVEDEPPCVEQGWVAVAALGCDVDDPNVLLALFVVGDHVAEGPARFKRAGPASPSPLPSCRGLASVGQAL